MTASIKRQNRINQLIKREISRIIFKEMEFPQDVMATVTRVELAADLKDANVFVSVLPDDKQAAAMERLEKKTFLLQKRINETLRMRPLPRLKFLPEKITSSAAKIEEILEQLKKEK